MLVSTPLLVVQSTDAKSLLQESIQHYQNLKSFSATIEHHNDSGLFPGDYTQSLKWRSGHRFELIVKTPSKTALKPGDPGMKAPNYFADGTIVVSIASDGARREAPVKPDPNTSPGWEVSGGLIATFLEKTAQIDFLLNPPANVKARYEWGKQQTWQGAAVREVVLVASIGNEQETISLLFDASKPILLGNYFVRNKKESWIRYRTQEENPTLSADLGVAPVIKQTPHS